MKKFPLLSAITILSAGFFGFLPLAHAQSTCDFSNNFACPSGQTCHSGQCEATPQAPAQTATPGSGSSGTGFTALAPIPGLTQGAVANSTGLAQFLNQLYIYIVGLAATLAVIEIIIGGLQISTQDSVSKKGEGKRRIEQALLGLVLVLSPALVFGIINPSILNLSVNIPPLKTAWGHWKPSAPCTGATCPQTLAPGLIGTTKLSSCTDAASCSVAESTCTKNAPPGQTAQGGTVCVKGSGSIDPNNPPKNYSCISGESLASNCVYSQSTGTFIP